MLLTSNKIKYYRGTRCSRKFSVLLLVQWFNQIKFIRCNENLNSIIVEPSPTISEASGNAVAAVVKKNGIVIGQ